MYLIWFLESLTEFSSLLSNFFTSKEFVQFAYSIKNYLLLWPLIHSELHLATYSFIANVISKRLLIIEICLNSCELSFTKLSIKYCDAAYDYS